MTTQEDVYQGFNIYLPRELQARLDLIMQTIHLFWEKKRYDHFTNHGPAHSERVHRQKLAQLAQELPSNQKLNPDEVFIVSAAAWLYEIGMQSPKLKPILDFEAMPGEKLTAQQLQQIRTKKHLLTYQMILDNVSGAHPEHSLPLGLTSPADDYTRAIAEICLWCNDEPLKNVPETLPVRGSDIRIRLLVALLRLADQLYIGSERVDLDLLVNRSRLSQRDFARWWSYHYAQTLPVAAGQIRFHYFMPESQRDYLAYIRALIEPEFNYEKNLTVQYLWENHQLRLKLQTAPSVRFDRQFGFQQLMGRDLMMYLYQQGERIETDLVMEETAVEHALLVLDYENLIIQLAKEGHFFELQDLSEAAITFLKAASDQFIGIIEPIAIGPWDRPDMTAAAKMLEDNIFQLVGVGHGQSFTDRLNQEIKRRVSEVNPPRHLTLIAPRKELARLARDLTAKGQQLVVWTSNLPEARIFQTFALKHELLSRLLSLSESGIDGENLDMVEKACILALDWEHGSVRDEIPFAQVQARLARIKPGIGNVDFWCTWLFNRDIILPALDRACVCINAESPEVLLARQMQGVVLGALRQDLEGADGIAQSQLLQQMVGSQKFATEESALQFLALLKERGALTRVPVTVGTRSEPAWQLDDSAEEVISAEKEKYLMKFVLALDHFMVREGRRTVHEHKLTNVVSNVLPARAATTLYEMAKIDKWVKRFDTGEKFRESNDSIFGVSPNTDSLAVSQVFRKQDILLNSILRISHEDDRMDALLGRLGKIKWLTIDESELWSWLKLLERQNIITTEAGPKRPGERFRLNLDEPLLRRLFGRMYIYGLVTTFRIQGASRRETKKPTGLLLDQLTKHVTRHNMQLAEWAVEYAKAIRLVCEDAADLYLNRHSLVADLGYRESQNCELLLEMVRRMGGGGWIPQGMIYSEMEKDVRFGWSRGEHEYWLNTVIHKKKWMEERSEDKGPFKVRQLRPVAH